MSALADILGSMQLSGGMFLDARFTAPWSVISQIEPDDCAAFLPLPRNIVALHYVSSGRLVLQVAGESPVVVEAGEIVALPRNDPHVLSSEPGLEPVGTHSLIRPGSDGRLASICHGGGGDATAIVCGFLGTDRPDDPVLKLLPRVIKLRIEDGASSAWIQSSFSFAASEFAASESRSAGVIAQLAEVLFMDAVRRYLDALPSDGQDTGTGLLDRRVANALALMHEQLRHRWTTEELAGKVGLSRSAFANRFTREMGESPMRYLARQRLRKASRQLCSTADPMARIAFECGYESESAFNRAFKREFGVPPGTWRKDREADTGMTADGG